MTVDIHPQDPMEPITQSSPEKSARRWNSPYDELGLEPQVSVYLNQFAYSRVCLHSVSDMDNEVGGILVGEWCVDEASQRQFIIVEAALAARHTRQSSVHLTFTPDSLVDIHNEIDKNYPGKKIVGWYHTHPRMGIFLSHYDTWLHKYFFPAHWQVALVIEPHAATGGIFIRQANGLFDPSRYFGFYEMDGALQNSLVHWTNLTPVVKEGETSNE
jgi:proteasome lid subunit RPN8/RPN11